jgi:hypothetical protein
VSRLPDWVVDAVSPTGDELERLEQPNDPGLLGGCADATAPTRGEVDSLLRRLRATAPVARPLWRRPVPALAAAALAVGLLAILLPSPPRPLLGEPIELAEGELLELGASIDLRGPATVVVRDHGRVELLHGLLRAEVEPLGEHRELAILSGALTTVVVGTRFEVTRDGGRETVSVERGRVRVQTPAGARLLGAGESLSWPGPLPEAEETALNTGTGPAHRSTPPADEPVDPPDESLPSEPVALLTPDRRRAQPPAPEPDEPRSLAELLPEIQIAELGPEIEPEDVRDFRRIQENLEMNTAPDITLLLTEAFLAKHRDSALAHEARIIRLELLAQTGSPREALGELDRWLAAHADHPQFLALLELRADTARDGLRDCRGALPGYRVLATRARGERRARAQALRGICAVNEGLYGEARESLTEAVENHFLPESLRFEATESLAALEQAGTLLPLRKAQ